MQIFAGVRWRGGVKWECGRWKCEFSLLSFTVFRTFYTHGHTTAFTWCHCRWPWRYFKVIRLFRIKFLVNGALYGNSYYSGFRLVPLLMTLKYIWRSFQSRLSFPSPFQQSLSGFRVARSPSNSWVSVGRENGSASATNVVLLAVLVVIRFSKY